MNQLDIREPDIFQMQMIEVGERGLKIDLQIKREDRYKSLSSLYPIFICN
ncbi:hypothetical protein [Priestia megaterium]